MASKERLRRYIEEDPMYVEYKNGVNNAVSDFDRFCINHCEDIEDLLDEVEELHNKIDKANATIDTNLELIEHLGNKIDKAIEYIEKHSFFVDDTGYGKIIGYPNERYNAQELLEILKESDVDE